MESYHIRGRVIDRRTKRGVPGLEVEAWDKDLIKDDLVGNAETDQHGRFQLTFDERHFKETFLERRPDLTFQLSQGGKPIEGLDPSVQVRPDPGTTQAVIEIDAPSALRGHGRRNRGKAETETREKPEEGELIRRRSQWVRQLLDVEDTSRLHREIDRVRARSPPPQQAPFLQPSKEQAPADGEPEVVAREEIQVDVQACSNPAENETWGHTGRHVRVRSKQSFSTAFLRLTLSEAETAHLVPGSVRLARWDDDAQRFRIVPASEHDPRTGRLEGRITRPGTYTAIGLPRDPRILTTLKLLDTVRPLGGMLPDGPRGFVPPICKVILCTNHGFDPVVGPEVRRQSGFEPGDFPGGGGFGGGFGGDVCEMCLGTDPGGSPEIDLLDPVIPGRIPDWPTPGPVRIPRTCARWENVGPPNVTGRVGDLALHPDDGDTLYTGTTGGGVWRTTDGGASWEPLMSDELSLAIGGLGISGSAPEVLYAATGEWTGGIGFPTDPVTRGVGVYKTTDGGADWDLCAEIPSEFCSSVAVDPTDPERVFVGGENGLHRSTDGGASWDIPTGNTFGVFDGEVSDVVLDPDDPKRVFIGVHRDGVYRSENGGATWTRLDDGIGTGFTADAPKIALGRNGTNGTDFVAVKMGDNVYTSTDGGDTFTQQTSTPDGISYFAWCNTISVDPEDEDTLLVGGLRLYRSTDGGANWTAVGSGTVHADQQGVAFDPDDPNNVYVATDGGIWRSADNGASWSFASQGLTATHFYVMGVSQTPRLRYGGSVQDDSGFAYDGAPDWINLGLGEGGYLEYDPTDEDVLYHDTWFGTRLSKSTDGGATWTNLGIQTDANYVEPLIISHDDPDILLALKTSGAVARSPDGGTTWTDVLDPPGVNFSAIRFAPSDEDHVYAASTTGRVWHSDAGGVSGSWTELDTTPLPDRRVQSLAVDPSDPRRVYAAFAATGIRHLFRGDLDAAGDARWFDVSGAEPAVSLPDLPLTGLALHPTKDEVLFVSTMLGVYRSVDGGDSWYVFDDGLPNAFVSDLDLRVRDRTLYASTMGRGIYRRRV